MLDTGAISWGRVYAIRAEDGLCKIGSAKSGTSRAAVLAKQIRMATECVWQSDGVIWKPYRAEFAAHMLLFPRIHWGEWFEVTAQEASEAARLGVEWVCRFPEWKPRGVCATFTTLRERQGEDHALRHFAWVPEAAAQIRAALA